MTDANNQQPTPLEIFERGAKYADEVLNDPIYSIGERKLIRAALSSLGSQPDVDTLKKECIGKGGSEIDTWKCIGWNACIDELVRRGLLKTGER